MNKSHGQDEPWPGLLVTCTGVYYRLTHKRDGKWYGARLGTLPSREVAEQAEQPGCGTGLFVVPRPFLWEEQ